MSDNFHYEETIKSEKIYEGKIIKVKVDTVELPNRSYAKREIVIHGRGVAIVVINDENKLYLVKQFRKPLNKVIYEIPAGIVEPNESIQEAAIREAQEEIGQKPNKLELVTEAYASPGFTDEIISIFLATELEENKLELDDDEYVEVELVSIQDALDMIDSFEITDAKSIIGILYAARKLGI